MENTDKNINKATETLVKELESMSNEGLRDFFKFVYKLNHQHYNMFKIRISINDVWVWSFLLSYLCVGLCRERFLT